MLLHDYLQLLLQILEKDGVHLQVLQVVTDYLQLLLQILE